MNSVDLYINSLAGIITLSIGFVFFYYFWQQYVIDVTRQQLFELRDRIFDLATEERLNRDSEAYRVLREMFNSAIRFTHRLGYIQIFTLSFFRQPEIKNNALRVQEILNSIENIDTKHEVNKLLNLMSTYLILQQIKRSLLLLILVPILLLIYILINLSLHFYDNFSRRSTELFNGLAYKDAMQNSNLR